MAAVWGFALLVAAQYGRAEATGDLTASLAMLPRHAEYGPDGAARGGFVEVARAIGACYPQSHLSLTLYPFPRSIYNVISGRATFHIPLIRVPEVPDRALPFSYAAEPVTRVAFVLYSQSGKAPLDLSHLDRYEIGTMRGHAVFFPFPVQELSSIESGIKMVRAGRLDGYIMEQDAVDGYIRSLNLHDIRRALYRVWDSCVVIHKGDAEADRTISNALRDLKRRGVLQPIIAHIHQPYSDWQPFEAGR